MVFLHPETADILGWISTLYRGVSFCALGVMGSVSGNHLLDDLSWIQQPKMSPIVAKRPLGGGGRAKCSLYLRTDALDIKPLIEQKSTQEESSLVASPSPVSEPMGTKCQ